MENLNTLYSLIKKYKNESLELEKRPNINPQVLEVHNKMLANLISDYKTRGGKRRV